VVLEINEPVALQADIEAAVKRRRMPAAGVLLTVKSGDQRRVVIDQVVAEGLRAAGRAAGRRLRGRGPPGSDRSRASDVPW
jgi:hypothetical protein